MATNFFKIKRGQNLQPVTGTTVNEKGDLAYNDSTSRVETHNGSTAEVITTDSVATTLSNKSLDNSNSISAKDNSLTIEDNTDGTKKFKFEAASISPSTTRTITIPDESFTLSTPTSSETLENKNLVDASTAIVDSSDPTIKIKFDAAGTTATTTTLTSSQTANRTITLPDATTTMVGTDVAQDITNKTSIGVDNLLLDGNTISSTDTNGNVVIDPNGNGNINLTAAGTGVINVGSTNVNVDAAGSMNIVGDLDVDNLNLNGNTISSTDTNGDINLDPNGTGQVAVVGTALTLPEISTPATPASGNGKVYFKSDNSLYQLNDQGVESKVGGGAGGTKNYLTAYIASTGSGAANTGNGDLELGSTTGFSLGNVSLTSNFPSGSPTFGSGASGNLSLSAISSSQLAGRYSLGMASSAATTAGNFVATDAFYIDLEDQAKPLQYKISYQAAVNPANGNFSGTSSNSFGVALYDVTNSAWIQPAGVFNLVQSSGVGLASGTFQTSANGTQYRLVVYNANASAGAITMYLDDFFVGPQITAAGAAISDWKSFTPTVTGFSGGFNGSTNMQYRRVGGNLELQGHILMGTNLPNTTIVVSIPSGIVADISVGDYAGIATAGALGALGNSTGAIIMQSSTTWAIISSAAASYWNATNPVTWGATNSIILSTFSVPIVGWSSNTVMSNDTDTRVVALIVNKSSGTNTASGGNQDISGWDAPSTDTHGAFNPTTGYYTAPVSGVYEVDCTVSFSGSSAVGFRVGYIYINGIYQSIGIPIVGSTAIENTTKVSGNVTCKAGDVISIQTFQNSGGNLNYSAAAGYTRLCINRLSGPATISATETVAARYISNADQTIGAATAATVQFNSKDYDTHNAVTTGASWEFKAPVSGLYRIDATISLYANESWTSDTDRQLYVTKNGTGVGLMSAERIYTGAYTQRSKSMNGSQTLKLLAGDSIKVLFYNADITYSHKITYQNTSQVAETNICIVRVGN